MRALPPTEARRSSMRFIAVRRIAQLAALAAAIVLSAQPAEARTVHFRAASVHAGKLVFPVRGVRAGAVIRAAVHMRGHRGVPVPRRLARRGMRRGRVLITLRRLGFRHSRARARRVVVRRRPTLLLRVARKVDRKPPETTISSGPATSTTSATAGFTFSSSESGSRFQCRTDGGAWSACASPWTGSFAAGPHLFEVRAIDQAGNVDSTPSAWTWTVVTAQP